MGCKAEKSVMVGNNFQDDILGAINAGMSAILVNSELTKSEMEYIKKEHLELDVINDLDDIKDLL